MTPPLEAAREASLVALGDAWTELRGYVSAAVTDDTLIRPRDLAAYMDELKRRAYRPLREALQGVTNA